MPRGVSQKSPLTGNRRPASPAMLQGDKAHLFQVLRELLPGLFTGFSTESVDKFSRESQPQTLLVGVKFKRLPRVALADRSTCRFSARKERHRCQRRATRAVRLSWTLLTSLTHNVSDPNNCDHWDGVSATTPPGLHFRRHGGARIERLQRRRGHCLPLPSPAHNADMTSVDRSL